MNVISGSYCHKSMSVLTVEHLVLADGYWYWWMVDDAAGLKKFHFYTAVYF